MILFARQDLHEGTYGVALDDQRLPLAARVSLRSGETMVVVQNFFEELKTKVGN